MTNLVGRKEDYYISFALSVVVSSLFVKVVDTTRRCATAECSLTIGRSNKS